MAQSQVPLKVAQSTRNDGKIQLDITVPALLIGEARKGAALVLSEQNQIDLNEMHEKDDASIINTVIEKAGEPQFQAFLNHYTMTALAPFAVSQQKLEIVMDPQISSSEQVVEGRDFHFVAIVTPKPIYELVSYDPVTVKVPRFEVAEIEIDQQLYYIAESCAEYVEDENAEIGTNSEVAFAIETTDVDGKPVKMLTAERRVYRLGEGYLSEEFDKNLLGLKVHDVKTFDFDIPDFKPDDSADATMPMVTVTTTVTIKQVMKRVIPAITDAWVQANIPDSKDVDGLRETIRAKGTAYKAQQQEKAKLYAVPAELAKRFEGTIDDELYEFTARNLRARIQEDLRQQGISLEDFLKQQHLDEQSFAMQIMLQTRETLRQGFALDALARHLKLTVTDKDIENTLEAIAPDNKEEARMRFEGSGHIYLLTEAALRDKANKWLCDTATFEYVG